MNYEAKASDWVLLPASARKRNDVVTAQQSQLEQDSVESSYNKFIDASDHSTGIIASGIAFNYLNECYPDGCPYPVLKISQYPLPKKLVIKLASRMQVYSDCGRRSAVYRRHGCVASFLLA